MVPNFIQAEPAQGLAITDPHTLRKLDDGDLGLGRMLAASRNPPLTNDVLFAQPALAPLRRALEAEFTRYVERHKATRPGESLGVGASYDVQLFDEAQLYAADTRFVLTGVVNRMDRAFVAPETCGEIRLIYRLMGNGEGAPSRLPMTLNLVLRARQPGDAQNCAEIARRWLSSDAPLATLTPDHIDRLEINLQIAHAPRSATREFRTHYLQKVFRRGAPGAAFAEAAMENQIDAERLLADADLARAFRTWLLTPDHLAAFDAGTVVIPEEFLATSSVASTPAGMARSSLQPSFGLMQSDHAGSNAVFSDGDIVAALAAVASRGVVLQNIHSPAGFVRRLGDIGCGGCHQVRGIGGFHFPGGDAASPATVAMSPHFNGDQPRRRYILVALRDGVAPDFSRGFSDRPQARRSTGLAGTAMLDGWGATCYRPQPIDNDASFAAWNCAEGLSCQPVGADMASRFGMCFVQ
ncbi:hypothetical protein FNL55_08455 [Tardiphaga sp. vice352]|nr:hypothetical protein FIU28_08090 [Tardiphaga sp. vice154]QDM29588.1 hypothetical protein FNL56_08810 [Tardiphaga sp. vice304]QDM34696.1 hypothetical protein FNL55_08455 [Tardiphaga sp. vice352]